MNSIKNKKRTNHYSTTKHKKNKKYNKKTKKYYKKTKKYSRKNLKKRTKNENLKKTLKELNYNLDIESMEVVHKIIIGLL